MDNVVARLSNGHSAAKSLKGIYSICSAHPWVLAAAMQQAVDDGTPLLVESTSNQVDQYGGYTGMKPADFIRFAHGIAEQVGLPREHLILGGDHLGPNAWRSLPAEEAMRRAEALMCGQDSRRSTWTPAWLAAAIRSDCRTAWWRNERRNCVLLPRPRRITQGSTTARFM
jgi:hypothetical protein